MPVGQPVDIPRLRELAANHTSRQCAELLGVNPTHLRKLIRNHGIKPVPAPRGTRSHHDAKPAPRAPGNPAPDALSGFTWRGVTVCGPASTAPTLNLISGLLATLSAHPLES